MLDIPGSHVVISGNLDPSDSQDRRGRIAAYFSQGRLSNLVQVDMIEVKKLNKPTGGKPGLSPTQDKRPSVSQLDPEKLHP